jgi:hypothetical protein
MDIIKYELRAFAIECVTLPAMCQKKFVRIFERSDSVPSCSSIPRVNLPRHQHKVNLYPLPQVHIVFSASQNSPFPRTISTNENTAPLATLPSSNPLKLPYFIDPSGGSSSLQPPKLSDLHLHTYFIDPSAVHRSIEQAKYHAQVPGIKQKKKPDVYKLQRQCQRQRGRSHCQIPTSPIQDFR